LANSVRAAGTIPFVIEQSPSSLPNARRRPLAL
jgi:hypothetical protein